MTHVSRTPALVSLNQLGFQFANGDRVFDAVDLKFNHTPTAIIGRNGVGKSVLARLIAGDLLPTTGSITRSVESVYVAQAFVEASGQTVAQATGSADILSALNRFSCGCGSAEDFDLVGEQWDLAERLRRLLDNAGLAEIAFDDPTAHLSGGQQARIALIRAFLRRGTLLILDEPTNHLDTPGRQWLMDMLDSWRSGMIIVSHDRKILDRMQRIVELSELGVTDFGGRYSDFREQQRTLQAAAQARLNHARSERQREHLRMRREHDTIQRHAASSRRNAETANIASFEYVAIKGAAREIMGHVRQGHRTRKSELDTQVQEAFANVQAEDCVLVNLPASAVPNSRQVCTLIDAQLPWLPASIISLVIHGPMRIAVSGPNGCGKSTLLKMLAGQLDPVGGHCATHVPFAFIDQQLSSLDGSRSIVDQVMAQGSALDEGTLRSHLRHLQLDALCVTQPCSTLSGGERLKASLALAAWGKTPAQLLLLDEPTNHLDLPSVEAFEQSLRNFSGALVAVSHDQDFLQALNPTHYLHWHATGWQLHPTN